MQIATGIEFQEVDSQTRPARVAWLLPQDVTNDELGRVIQWSTENVGLWRSAIWQVGVDGRLDALGEHLIRKYDPDVVYGARVNVDEGYIRGCFNPFEVFSDQHVLNRDSIAAHTVGIEVIEAVEPLKFEVARRTFSGDALKVLWSASQLGVLSDRIAAKLAADGTTVNTIAVDVDKPGQFYEVTMLALEPALTPSPISPCAIQQRHLALKSNRRDSWYTTPAIVVVGDSTPDFCLYWTLRAIRAGVYWAPRTGLANWVQFRQEFYSLLRYQIPYSHQSTALISVTVPQPALAEIAAEIGPEPGDQRVSPVAVNSLADIDQLVPGLMPLVVMYSHHSESVPFVNNVSGAQLPRASSGKIALAEPSRLQFYHEVGLHGHRVPPRRQYNARLVPEPPPGSRASREGWSYSPVNFLTFPYDTWETAQIVVHLKVQDKLDECLAVFPPEFNPRLSASGQYLMHVISLFDDPVTAASFLTDGPVARLLDAYKRKRKEPPDSQVPGEISHDQVPGEIVNHRRYLDFFDIRDTTGLDGDPLRLLLEQLIERRVLRRGFAFQCPYCSWTDFYRLGSFDDQFECRQCDRQTRWQLKHAHHEEFPELFYGLDEIVYRVAEMNGHAVLRALRLLSEGTSSFMVAPGVNIDWPGEEKPWEFDAVLLIDGRVVLSEVKNTTTADAKQLNRYRSAAERLHADEVFVVSTKGWDQPTTRRIERLRKTLSAQYIKVTLANLELEHLP